MTHTVLVISSWVESWQEGIASFIKEISVKRKASKLRKNTINELSRLSDKDLQDMGLYRGMIRELAEEHYKAEVNKNLKGWV